MACRHTSRLPIARNTKRTSQWIAARLTSFTIPAGSPTLIATLNAAVLALRPFTVVRSHIVLSILLDQVATSEFIQGAFAAQVVTETAAAAGVASVSTPLDQADADFFIYQPWMSSFLDATSVGFGEISGSGSVWTIDSKAMRKVGADADIAFMVDNIANGYNLAMEGRMLIKLH